MLYDSKMMKSYYQSSAFVEMLSLRAVQHAPGPALHPAGWSALAIAAVRPC